jgi:hypothetical protein
MKINCETAEMINDYETFQVEINDCDNATSSKCQLVDEKWRKTCKKQQNEETQELTKRSRGGLSSVLHVVIAI